MNTLNYSRFYAFSLVLAFILTVSALLLNNYLIPLYGMEGAALSNLLSYGLYYLLVIATFVPLCRIRIIDRQWLYILLLILAVFGLNWLWQTYLPSFGIWTDSILRSVVLLGGACLIAYKAQLSPELNDQINHLKKKIINLKS